MRRVAWRIAPSFFFPLCFASCSFPSTFLTLCTLRSARGLFFFPAVAWGAACACHGLRVPSDLPWARTDGRAAQHADLNGEGMEEKRAVRCRQGCVHGHVRPSACGHSPPPLSPSFVVYLSPPLRFLLVLYLTCSFCFFLCCSVRLSWEGRGGREAGGACPAAWQG